VNSAARRRMSYLLVNAATVLAVAMLSLAGPSDHPRALYLILLTALCTTPLLLMEKLNGRFALLAAFFAVYLFFYGAGDFAALAGGPRVLNETGLLSLTEFGVLLGAALVLAGYRLTAGREPRQAQRPPRDWAPANIVLLGLGFWAVGTLTVWMWQVQVQVDAFTMKDTDTWKMLLLSAGRMLQPLGSMMLAYALFLRRSRWLLALVVATIALQVVVGFIGDSKETALRGLIIVIICAVLVGGRVPKAWLAVAAVFAALAFPVFQAYRAEVMGVRGMSRANAASNITRSLELALSARDKLNEAGAREEYRSQSFVQRASLKPTLAMMIARIGKDAEFRRGDTLSLFFAGFVPRIWWRDKPDNSVGQLLNRELHISEDRNTYISATHLGELYWNFAWPGVIAGMFALGLLLGFINRRCDLSQALTLTRLLVLVTTIYSCIVRFEASISLEYTVFVRSLLIIGVLHLLFARRAAAAGAGPAPAAMPVSLPPIPAPQLLR
jgi:hypothetical protein